MEGGGGGGRERERRGEREGEGTGCHDVILLYVILFRCLS